MHELAIAQEIVAIAAERAGARRVARVVVEIGALTAVVPDALRFCFELACQETPLDGAALEIRELAARGRCGACGVESIYSTVWAKCRCGSGELEWRSGDELVVKSMEMKTETEVS